MQTTSAPPYEEEDGEALDLMQRATSRTPRRSIPTPSSTDSAVSTTLVHVFHMSAEHRLLVIDQSTPLSYVQQFEAAWRMPRHVHLLAIHEVECMPNDLEATAHATFILEMSTDRNRQATPNDKLVLFDIIILEAGSIEVSAHTRRVVWLRQTMTRQAVLQIASATELCAKPEIRCELTINRQLWREDDMAQRQVLHGDYVRLQISGPATMTGTDIQVALCDQESADAQRYVFRESPPHSPTSQPSDRESAGRNSPRGTASPSEVLLSGSPGFVDSVGKPHVLDLWCADQHGTTIPCDPLDGLGNAPFGTPFHLPHQWDGRQIPGDIEVPQVAAVESLFEFLKDEVADAIHRADGCPSKRVSNDPYLRTGPSAPDLLLLQEHLPLNVEGSYWQTILQKNDGSTCKVAQLRKALLELRCWPEDSFCNCWDLIPDAHPYVRLIKNLQPEMSHVEALHIFTDGSFQKDPQTGAWAFSVVLQLHGQLFYRWGFTGGQIADCRSSIEAEATSTAHALLWMVSSLADTRYAVQLHGDATSVGFGADGTQNSPNVPEIQALHLRPLYQFCHSVMRDLSFHHVPAHSGQVDNELVDSVAKAIVVQQWSPFIDVPDIYALLNTPLFDWAWLLIEKEVGHNTEYPCIEELISGNGYSALPAQPVSVFPQEAEVKQGQEEVCLSIGILSANVRTLKGVAHLLAEQFTNGDFEIVALQETRGKTSAVSYQNGFLCLCAAAKAGRGGVELWFNQFGSIASSQYGPVTREHCHVWFQNSTVLCVECDHPLLACDIVAIYAPQSSLPADTIDDWWSELSGRLQARGRKDTIVLGDCNAKVGSIESGEIGPVGWVIEDRAGTHLRHLAADRSLILPSTFEQWHKGPTATFHGPAGGATRLDYIAVPRDWQAGIRSSAVAEVDLMNGLYDHSGVEVRLDLKIVPKSRMMRQKRACYDREAARQNSETLTNILGSIPVINAQVDVDTHWSIIMKHCQRQLQWNFPKPKRVKRQVYFSDATWNILNDRKDTKKEINGLDRRESLLTLAQYFSAWRRQPLELFCEKPSLSISMIRQEKAFLLWVRSQQAKLFKEVRKKDLLTHRASYEASFIEAVSSSSARRIFQSLRPKRPVSRCKGIKTRSPLPELQLQGVDEDGSRIKAVRVWEAHFSAIETATKLNPADFTAQMVPQVQRVSEGGLELDYFPTLCEFERALRALNWRKAPGYDGLGSELWQGNNTVTAKRLFALFVKAAARGQLPLQFRGGFLIPLYKSRGSHSAPSNFRGILLQDTMAKAFAKCWRSRLVDRFSRLAAPLQFGCIKGKGVSEAHLPLRLHLHIGACLKLATAVIFVDIKAAYYTVVKEFFFESTPDDGLHAIRGLFERLNLPEAALEDFVSTVLETDLLSAAGVPQVLRQLIQSTITASWFQIPGSDVICAPATGTRPGDPLADVLFAYVMSNVLMETYEIYHHEGILSKWEDYPPGTTWADDTCVMLDGDSDKIDVKAACAYSILQETLTKHGLSPTYGPGKTAIMCNYRGKGAAHRHHQRYKVDSPGVGCVFEHGNSRTVDAVHIYKHLGSIVDGDFLMPEIRARGQNALQAIRPIAKCCLADERIPLVRRRQLLQSLGISVLTHNAGTWRRLQQNEFASWATAVTKIYGCLAKVGPEGFPHWSIEELAHGAHGLLPDALLHVCRLRLCAGLLGGGEDAIAAMIKKEHEVAGRNSWFECLIEAIQWLENSIGSGAEMDRLLALTPADFGRTDLDLAKFLKRSVRKAQGVHQELLQEWLDHQRAEQQQGKTLRDYGWTAPSPPLPDGRSYKCKECGKNFAGEAHLATHRQRAHGILVASRRFAATTQCQACGRDHYTRPRLIRHLQYLSKKCLPWCLKHGRALSEDESKALDIEDAENIRKEKHTGIRSSASRLPVLHMGQLAVPFEPDEMVPPPAMPELHGHDRVPDWCLDFLQRWANVHGQWTVSGDCWDHFISELVEVLNSVDNSYLDSFKGRVYDLVEEATWRDEDNFEIVTKVLDSLYSILKDFLVIKPLKMPLGPVLPSEQLRRWEEQYGMLPIWMTSRDHTLREEVGTVPGSNIQDRLGQAERTLTEQELQWCPPEGRIPRVQIAEACYYLVLFSGHRREDDIASCLHRLPSQGRRSIHPVCMDLCLDTTRCNLLDPKTQALWFHRLASGQVIGLHASPPCETFTDARWLEPPPNQYKPRPLRSLLQPWGLEKREPREVQQCRVGSALFFAAVLFCTWAMVVGGCATLEHPKGTGPVLGRFRVWDSAFLRRLLRASVCKLYTFNQGPLGQVSVKPTTFLCIRLYEDIKRFVIAGSTYDGPFTPLGGLCADGKGWRTSSAKAFPPRLCEAIAQSVIAFGGRTKGPKAAASRLDLLDLPLVMTAPFVALDGCTGAQMGPDFWHDFT